MLRTRRCGAAGRSIAAPRSACVASEKRAPRWHQRSTIQARSRSAAALMARCHHATREVCRSSCAMPPMPRRIAAAAHVDVLPRYDLEVECFAPLPPLAALCPTNIPCTGLRDSPRRVRSPQCTNATRDDAPAPHRGQPSTPRHSLFGRRPCALLFARALTRLDAAAFHASGLRLRCDSRVSPSASCPPPWSAAAAGAASTTTTAASPSPSRECRVARRRAQDPGYGAGCAQQ